MAIRHIRVLLSATPTTAFLQTLPSFPSSYTVSKRAHRRPPNCVELPRHIRTTYVCAWKLWEIGDEDYYSEGSFFTTEKFGCCLTVYAVFFLLGMWLNDHALLSSMSSSIFTFLPLLLRSFCAFHCLPRCKGINSS